METKNLILHIIQLFNLPNENIIGDETIKSRFVYFSMPSTLGRSGVNPDANVTIYEFPFPELRILDYGEKNKHHSDKLIVIQTSDMLLNLKLNVELKEIENKVNKTSFDGFPIVEGDFVGLKVIIHFGDPADENRTSVRILLTEAYKNEVTTKIDEAKSNYYFEKAYKKFAENHSKATVHAEAISYFDLAIRYNPNSGISHSLKGAALLFSYRHSKEMVKQALKCFNKAISLGESDERIYEQIAVCEKILSSK